MPEYSNLCPIEIPGFGSFETQDFLHSAFFKGLMNICPRLLFSRSGNVSTPFVVKEQRGAYCTNPPRTDPRQFLNYISKPSRNTLMPPKPPTQRVQPSRASKQSRSQHYPRQSDPLEAGPTTGSSLTPSPSPLQGGTEITLRPPGPATAGARPPDHRLVFPYQAQQNHAAEAAGAVVGTVASTFAFTGAKAGAGFAAGAVAVAGAIAVTGVIACSALASGAGEMEGQRRVGPLSYPAPGMHSKRDSGKVILPAGGRSPRLEAKSKLYNQGQENRGGNGR